MNFELGTYNVRLTFNPADVTIRMEHRENRRLYESVFMTEDFDGLAAIGGLTTIEKILKAAFGPDSSAKITVVEEKIDTLTLKVEVSGLICKCWTLGLAARRRESGDTAVEVEELRTKIKSLEEEVKSLEDQLPHGIILPGCSVIIPYSNSLTLVSKMKTNIKLPTCPHCGGKEISDDRLSGYNIQNQQIYCTSGHGIHLSFQTYFGYLMEINTTFDFTTNTYVFNGSNIKPLSKLKKLCNSQYSIKSLTIQNNLITDCSIIGELVSLTSITLNCSRIRDISWAKNLKQLTELNLEGCTNLSDVNVLAELPALTKLNIKGTNVKNTAALTNSRLMIEK